MKDEIFCPWAPNTHVHFKMQNAFRPSQRVPTVSIVSTSSKVHIQFTMRFKTNLGVSTYKILKVCYILSICNECYRVNFPFQNGSVVS
jgi:hypothetical protein